MFFIPNICEQFPLFVPFPTAVESLFRQRFIAVPKHSDKTIELLEENRCTVFPFAVELLNG